MLKKIWKFLKRIVWGKDLIVYKIRKYLRELYEGYPSHAFYGYVMTREFQTGIIVLEEDKIIKYVATDEEGVKGYRLTSDGLRLVELWNTERLTFIIILITLLEILFIINFI